MPIGKQTKHSDCANRCKLLLIGFKQQQEAEIIANLSSTDWLILPAINDAHTTQLVTEIRFDFVLIDVDGVERFAPELVADLRAEGALNQLATILAHSDFMLPAFREQLLHCGVDGFFALPMETGNLLAALTDAAVKRALVERSGTSQQGEARF
ncbi:hypothetical protein J7443_06025 [Tropicibacter sp. R15_0]|uniref:hypothetical protein n=1 Tax=Tropicibacter sp. R15_0 TaxID=2821101 RepID=UPI001AD97E36|nr:hypothetical protein [Tropicibacter sp. R15_0]MBO9464778.1 hypothetical protein [Tropicibacter sp. R15_0]